MAVLARWAGPYRVLEDEARAAHELLPHLLSAAVGEVIPRDGEALAVRHAVPDLVHLPVHRPPLRLLRAHPRGGAEARRRRLGPSRATGHEATAAVRPPPLRVQAAQHPLASRLSPQGHRAQRDTAEPHRSVVARGFGSDRRPFAHLVQMDGHDAFSCVVFYTVEHMTDCLNCIVKKNNVLRPICNEHSP